MQAKGKKKDRLGYSISLIRKSDNWLERQVAPEILETPRRFPLLKPFTRGDLHPFASVLTMNLHPTGVKDPSFHSRERFAAPRLPSWECESETHRT
jgi:hypothetical protein